MTIDQLLNYVNRKEEEYNNRRAEEDEEYIFFIQNNIHQNGSVNNIINRSVISENQKKKYDKINEYKENVFRAIQEIKEKFEALKFKADNYEQKVLQLEQKIYPLNIYDLKEKIDDIKSYQLDLSSYLNRSCRNSAFTDDNEITHINIYIDRNYLNLYKKICMFTNNNEFNYTDYSIMNIIYMIYIMIKAKSENNEFMLSNNQSFNKDLKKYMNILLKFLFNEENLKRKMLITKTKNELSKINIDIQYNIPIQEIYYDNYFSGYYTKGYSVCTIDDISNFNITNVHNNRMNIDYILDLKCDYQYSLLKKDKYFLKYLYSLIAIGYIFNSDYLSDAIGKDYYNNLLDAIEEDEKLRKLHSNIKKELKEYEEYLSNLKKTYTRNPKCDVSDLKSSIKEYDYKACCLNI